MLHVDLSRHKGSQDEPDNPPAAEWFLEVKNPKAKGWLPSGAYSAFATTASRLGLDFATELIRLSGPFVVAPMTSYGASWLVRSTLRRRRG
jgi:hypothetical protein